MHLAFQTWAFFAIWQLSGIKQLHFDCGTAKHYSDGAKYILQEQMKCAINSRRCRSEKEHILPFWHMPFFPSKGTKLMSFQTDEYNQDENLSLFRKS